MTFPPRLGSFSPTRPLPPMTSPSVPTPSVTAPSPKSHPFPTVSVAPGMINSSSVVIPTTVNFANMSSSAVQSPFPRSYSMAHPPDPAFVVGPGFPSVSAKLVSSVVAGELVDLTRLINDSSESDPPPPLFSLWDDRVVLRPTAERLLTM